MQSRPSTDNYTRWQANPLKSSGLKSPKLPAMPRRGFPFLPPREDIRRSAPALANGLIGLLALVLAGALLLFHLAGLAGRSAVAAHVQAAAGLIAIAALAGLAGRVIRMARHRDAGAEAGHEAEIDALRREKLAAEAASAAKSRYLANVSHEIRSPLNAIYGYAQLMERGGEVDPGEAARVIRRSAEHLTNLVEGLLDISLIENGVLRISSDVVRFAPFLDQVASMFRHSAHAKGLRFDYQRPDRLPEFVRMDEKRLRQVLINLLSNAIKFTPAGTVTFRIRWQGQSAAFEISDTGPGIAAEDRERIFLPFERGSGMDTKPGIGLGLAITQALIQIQGGDLELESEVGRGATFRVRMMLGQVAGVAVDTEPGAPITGYAGARKSILIVDDDVHQLRLMRGLLESLGFDVAVAPNGEAGLALCAAGNAGSRFDLALLDISMPGLSGWQTARRLRARHGGDLRIAMLSGNAHERHGPPDGEPMHDLFLTKPIELDSLIDAIGALLALRWVRADAPDDAPAPGAGTSPLPAAAQPHVEKLRELLRIGHVRGIEAEIKALDALAPDSRDMIDRLYACLDRFDLPALRAVLDECP